MNPKVNRNQNFLIDKQIIELSNSKGLITNFDENFLSGCSYDLRVGKTVRSRSRLTTFDLDKHEYYAESGECFTIETLERVNLRDTLSYGLIFNKHSILGKGLFHPATTVDPGFTGSLAITFFNLGNTPIQIEKEMKICSIHFQPVTPKPEKIYGKNLQPSIKEGTTEFALYVDNPNIERKDELLAKMYGAPISRLFKKVEELESNFDFNVLKRDYISRKEKKQNIKTFWIALTTALIASLVSFLLPMLFNSGNSIINSFDKEQYEQDTIYSNKRLENKKDSLLETKEKPTEKESK